MFLDTPGYSRMVAFEEIEKNDYNLNIPRYIDSSATEDLHDLSAHLSGGIPNRDVEALEKYWKVFPGLRRILFADEREGYSRALIKAGEVKNTILDHTEFKAFAEKSLNLFNRWRDSADLAGLNQGDIPKEVIHRISESLLANYFKAPLLDPYDMYQIIMDYWAAIMQDDVYVIVQDGWSAGRILRELVVKKGEKLKETPDLILGKVKYKAELIPPALLVQRYFKDEQNEIDGLQSIVDASTQKLESYIEEHAVEGGLLEEALTDSGKVSKASVTVRLKTATDADEISALKKVKKLIETEASNKRAVKEASEKLDQQLFKKYPKLSIDECKALIVNDKWIFALENSVIGEIERVTQQLANRVKTLEERYAEPLPVLVDDVEKLSATVDEHLRKMGLSW